MKATIRIEDKEEAFLEVINVNDIDDVNSFFYVDAEGSDCHLEVFENGIIIKKVAYDHLTNVVLRDNSYIELTTLEGTIKFSVKVLEYRKNNDNIFIVYSINDAIKNIQIKYIGD